MITKIIFTLFIKCIFQAYGQDPIVNTTYGPVAGKSITLDDDTVVDVFLGIPFAKPPLGLLRFELPEEPDPWENVLEAFEPGDACVQDPSGVYLSHSNWTRFSENCLHLNIYSPQGTDSEELLPVIVYIHGGDYSYGANFMYMGYIMARKNVVVATINYRLGILGFAYSGDGVISGNMGLMDQIQALKFVQTNIEAFGGDPKKVTIMGESAGGSSAGQLLFSPFAEELFNGAIMQSGCEMAIWPTHFPDFEPENFVADVASQFGCPTTPSEAMVTCLRTIDAEALVAAYFTCPPGFDCWGFRPVIDGIIIPDTYENLRKAGNYIHVPEMIGNNENDWNYFILYYPELALTGIEREEFNALLLGRAARLSQAWPESGSVQDVYEAFKFFYADWPYYEDPERNRDMLGDMVTDQYYGAPGDLQAKLHNSANNQVFYYIFDYLPKYNDPIPEWVGAYHGLENKFIFGWPYMLMEENAQAYAHSKATVTREFDEEDFIYSDFMMTLWTNFAKYGTPTHEEIEGPRNTSVQWPEFNSTELNYLYLSNTPEVKQDYRQQSYAFWQHYVPYLIYDQVIDPE